MRMADLVHETNASLLAKKGRNALTVLGIAVGITAVVVMVSLIGGFETWLEDSMGLGSARVVTVTSQDSQHALQEDDASFLVSAIDSIEQALPSASTTESVASQNAESSDDITLSLQGVEQAYYSMENVSLVSGSLPQDSDENELLLDENAVESIYGSSSYNPVGQGLTLGSESYTVVGVAESSSLMSGLTGLAMGYVSYANMTGKLLGAQQVDAVYALASEDSDVDYVSAQVAGALAARHGIELDDDGSQSVYSATTTSSALESLSSFTVAFDALAALVAGIALLVGGIGIMNMMLTNVTERYREIGLRKSLGARPGDIKLQFLAESVALCVAGGVVGTLAGYAGAFGLASAVVRFNSSFEGLAPEVQPGLVLLVFCICAGIGIVFGYYPAAKAAKLNPAQTLRYQ